MNRIASRVAARQRAAVGILIGLLSLVCGTAVKAQLSIDWFKIVGGGGNSTGGVYSLSGTIGQADAGGPMTNGTYSLTGGFWVLPSIGQTPGAPTLYLTNAAPGFVALWWTPPTRGFVLQTTDGLSTTNWVSVPSGADNPATTPATLPAPFYCLHKP